MYKLPACWRGIIVVFVTSSVGEETLDSSLPCDTKDTPSPMGEGSMRTNVSELRMRVRVDFCYAQHICKKNAVIQKPDASELYMLRNSVTEIIFS